MSEHYLLRLRDALTRDPARTVLRWRGRDVAAAELSASVTDLAAALHRAGVDAASTVAVLTEPNTPATLAARYAAHLLGATVTYVRSMNARADSAHLPLAVQRATLVASGARFLVVDAGNAARGALLANGLPGARVLHVDEVPRATREPDAAPYRPDAVAVLDLTSGTTNRPKLVRQTWAARDARVALTDGGVGRDDRPVLLCVTPVSHSTATLVDAAIVAGGTAVLHDGFDPLDVLRSVAEDRVTDAYLAVPHLYRLLDSPATAATDLGSLRQVIYSGTAAAPARVAQAVATFGPSLHQLYGSTEAGGITVLTPLDHAEPELIGAVGRPFPWVEVEVRETGRDVAVPRGETGELCVRSPTLMAGYLGEPDLTGRVLRDGWLRTGDLGYRDRYGYLRLVGRLGNLIKANGLKLYPAAIEAALLSHPSVADVAVYGVGDPATGEEAHAAVRLRAGARCGVDELRRHLAGTLSPEHVPAGLAVWDEIPLLGSGKPDYASLRSGYAAHLGV